MWWPYFPRMPAGGGAAVWRNGWSCVGGAAVISLEVRLELIAQTAETLAAVHEARRTA